MDSITIHQKASWGPAIAATIFIFAQVTDMVMMPIATTAVVDDLKTDTGMIQNTIALTSLVAASLFILAGKLGDISGKKKIFMIGVLLFAIGPLVAALAPGIEVLIVGWSVVKALGMALAIPTSIGLLIASYPDDNQRGRAFAIYAVGAVCAALVGPLLMGFCAQELTWRLPFGLLAGLAVIAFLLTARSVRETEKVEGARIDWGGTALATLAVASIIMGSMLGGRYGWWLARRQFTIGGVEINPLDLSPAPWLIGFGLIVIAILLIRSSRMEEKGGQPLFSMRLFDNRTFFASWGLGLVAFVLVGAMPFIIPVFTQQALAFDSLDSGIVMSAFSVGSIILGFASAKLVQSMQARTLMLVSLLVIAAGLVWLVANASTDMKLWDFILPMFIIGAGFGVVIAQIPNISLSTLSKDLQGEGSGLAETGKQLGIGLGVAVIASIMFSVSIGGFVDKVARQADIPLTSEERNEAILLLEDEAFPAEAEKALARMVPNLEEFSGVVPNLEELSREAYVEGFQVAMGTLVGLLLLAMLLASLIPKVKVEAVTAQDVKEAVADVSNTRL